MFWVWTSGFSAALALTMGARGDWWGAAAYVVVSGFCVAARNAFPEETRHNRRNR